MKKEKLIEIIKNLDEEEVVYNTIIEGLRYKENGKARAYILLEDGEIGYSFIPFFQCYDDSDRVIICEKEIIVGDVDSYYTIEELLDEEELEYYNNLGEDEDYAIEKTLEHFNTTYDERIAELLAQDTMINKKKLINELI